MQRRAVISGAALGFLTLLAACGGGDGSDGDDGRAEVLEPEVEPGEHEHINGAESLPRAGALDLALLAQPTTGSSFHVQVKLGAQVCAHAGVQIYDIHGALIDSGTTDAAGLYRSTQTGRKFLVARADVAGVGSLYGFELNTIGKGDPTIDVNLLPTLLQRLNERQPLDAGAAEFLLKMFLNIRQDALISDAEGLAGRFDQERMRLHFAQSGLPLAAYVDGVVDHMLAALERGLAAPESLEYQRLLGVAALPEHCKTLPVYDESWSDDWDDPTWAVLLPLIKDNWPTATKAIANFVLKKVAEASGYAFITPVGELILNKLLSGQPNPQKEALQEIQDQLRVLQTAVQAMEQKFKEAEFTRLYDEVRNTFNEIDAIARDMAETQDYYTRNKLATDKNYNDLVIARCNSLFAKETALLAAENKFIGLGAFAGSGLLNRWHAIHRNRPFFTAIIQKQYMDLLDYYVAWMDRVYAYIVNAYTAYAETVGVPVNMNRVKQLKERMTAQVKMVEDMRPRYLPSEKLVFDLTHGLAWVGRGNVATDFRTFIPADFNDSHYKRRDASNFLQIGYQENNPCRERIEDSPFKDSSVGEDLAKELSWRLPTKNDMERSFGARIKERYGKKFNLATFRADLDIPATFALFDDSGEPVQPVVRDGMNVKRVRVQRGVYRYYLWLSVYRLVDLGSGSFPNHSSYPPIRTHYFPVATMPADKLAEFLPWSTYDKALAHHVAGLV